MHVQLCSRFGVLCERFFAVTSALLQLLHWLEVKRKDTQRLKMEKRSQQRLKVKWKTLQRLEVKGKAKQQL